MSWDNYGVHGWHIDHRRPVASFDLTDPIQQAQCFHYTNLQPMWAPDNHTKGARYDGTRATHRRSQRTSRLLKSFADIGTALRGLAETHGASDFV